jgi:hypothetical protein
MKSNENDPFALKDHFGLDPLNGLLRERKGDTQPFLMPIATIDNI